MGGPVQLVVMIIAIILQIALAPRPQKPRIPTLDDMELPQCDEGTPQIVVFGDVWIKAWTVLSYGNFALDQIKKSTKK